MGSRQYIEEWKIYKSILDECKVKDKTLWLDVRGNHGKRQRSFCIILYNFEKLNFRQF